jgi:hypothetical protein
MVIHGCTTSTGVLFMGSSNKNVRKNGIHAWWCAAVCAAKESIEEIHNRNKLEIEIHEESKWWDQAQFPVEVYGPLQGLLCTFYNWNTFISMMLELACSLLSFNLVLLGVQLSCSVWLAPVLWILFLQTVGTSQNKISGKKARAKLWLFTILHVIGIP